MAMAAGAAPGHRVRHSYAAAGWAYVMLLRPHPPRQRKSVYTFVGFKAIDADAFSRERRRASFDGGSVLSRSSYDTRVSWESHSSPPKLLPPIC